MVGDGPLRTAMESLAGQLGIAEIVNFVGHVPDAAPYLDALDLLVMCSDHEGTPMTLLEAWRSRVPVVAHDVGGLSELLSGDCGALVEEHSAVAYAEAVQRLLVDDSMKAKYIQNAATKLHEEYSATKNKAMYVNLYQQVLESS